MDFAIPKAALLAVLALSTAVACGGERAFSRTPRASLIAEASSTAVYRSPAVWRYHPKEAGSLAARYELGEGKVLLAGERGERWLRDSKTQSVQAAARLAPEDLIAILRPDATTFLFVGASGTAYQTAEPLGPFVRSSAPLDALARVTAGGSAIVGIRRDGALFRSADSGGSWQSAGPTDVRFIDIELTTQGRGLALAVPEQLWETADHGATWKRLDVAPFGALALARDQNQKSGLVVSGALDKRRWDAGPLVPFSGELVKPSHALEAEPPRGPDAGALAEGRAAIVGTRYLEIVPEPKRSSHFRLLSGSLDGALQPEPLPEAQGCRSVRISGFGQFVYLACARTGVSNSANVLEFYRSEDGGKTFKPEPYSVKGRIGELTLAVGAGGALVVSGVCPPQASGTACNPFGVHHRRKSRPEKRDRDKHASAADHDKNDKTDSLRPVGLKAPELELALSATPALDRVASALAFSADGRIAYAVAKRKKSGAFAIFVSVDGGRTFVAREIEQIAADAAEESDEDRIRSSAAPSEQRVVSLSSAEDGTLAVVFRRYGTSTLVVSDDGGRVMAVSQAPSDSATLGAAGTRALAFLPTTREAWETLDAGASWEPIGRIPLTLCPGDAGCEVPVRCHVTGCVIGDQLSRVGWRGQADDDPGVLSPPEPASSALFDRKLGAALSCSLGEGGWQRIDGVARLPDANEAALGKLAWFSFTADENRASLVVHQAASGARPRVDSSVLLAPAPRPETLAFSATPNVEGVAALRYSIPETTPGETRLLNVEIAWLNALEGRVGRARIPDAGSYVSGDYARTANRAQRALPDLVSITDGGLYLRIHQLVRDAQPTLFVDGRSVQTIPPVTWPTIPPVTWPATASSLEREVARVGGVHTPFLVLGEGTAFVRARRETNAWSFAAMATGLPDTSELEQSGKLAYLGSQPGLHVIWFDKLGPQRRGLFYPLRATGAALDPPVPVPTQLDLGSRPSRCSPTQRTSTPRVVVPFQAGTRHAVVISDASEPLRVLLTGEAVLFGTPDSSCLAAWDAYIVDLDPTDSIEEPVRAILPFDELEHSWLFRGQPIPQGQGRMSAVEWRSMSCRIDPNVEVPPEVFGAAGTLVRRGQQ